MRKLSTYKKEQKKEEEESWKQRRHQDREREGEHVVVPTTGLFGNPDADNISMIQ